MNLRGAGDAMMHPVSGYAQPVTWHPERPRLDPLRLALSWLLAGIALLIAAWLVPGASFPSFRDAVATAVIVALLNAVLPPLVAALRLPFMLVLGFLLVLV